MNEDAFLAAIRTDRKDVTLRQVYADWLEERGDSRAELVRIEEEMRQLPAYSDRFWLLKGQRNELRARAPTDWLESMGYGTDCQPLFGHGIPDGWKERWRLIREFTERWHRLPLADVGGRADEIREAQTRLDRVFPPSVREWVAFAHDVRRDPDDPVVLRDCYQMRELEGHSAVSLLLQGEGDYHWTVRHEDFALPDPAVYGYILDVHNRDGRTFVPDEQNPIADAVTAFVLEYVMAYTHAAGGGFHTIIAKPAKLIRNLRVTFPVRSKFGQTEFFEAENILVRLYPSHGGAGRRIVVEVAKPLPREAIPAFLWDYTGNGGSFHGMFIPAEMRAWHERMRAQQAGGSQQEDAAGDEIPF
jgi:uncharacterized protein (TIGR02996 family)